MDDDPIEWRRGEYRVATNRTGLRLAEVLELLRATGWAEGLTEARLARAVTNSVCFGLSRDDELVGFGRVVSDLSTYGYLTDVVIAPGFRRRGLGEWLTGCMLRHPDLQGFRRMALLTRDAEPLYRRAGFVRGAGGLIYMERRGEGAVSR
jgi:ribosomal protein S18 acetylase RimI-like enzyme